MDRSRIAILIPAYNEAATIGAVVRGAAVHGSVLVVDDASTDGTARCAGEAGASVVSHEQNRGYEAALNSGFAEAERRGFAYLLTFDADGQHDAALIPRFAQALDAGAELVLGVRPRTQRLAEALFAGLARVLWGVRDPLCGMKAYTLALYRERGWFDSSGSIGTELALWAVRQGRRFEQVEVPIHPRHDAPRFARRLHGEFRIARALLRSVAASRSWPDRRRA
jgi:glycosyltransferase involved in cell wall biosynthesis